jgi:hypothetical protein
MHPELRAVADRRGGVFSTGDARTTGHRPDEIRHLLTRRAWRTLRRGVYATAEDVVAAEQAGGRHRLDCAAVLCALGRQATVVSHASAADLHGLLVPDGSLSVVRLTDPEQWRQGRGYRVAVARVEESEVVTVSGLRTTSVDRTLVDCAREWPLEDAVVSLDDALGRELTTPAALHATVLAATHWPGAAAAARAVGLANGRADSPLETRGRLQLVSSGFPLPELQVELRDGHSFLGVVDAWYEDSAIAVEFDGRTKYADPWRGRTPEQALWDEKRREDRIRAAGVRLVRVVHADLENDWDRIRAQLDRLMRTPAQRSPGLVARPAERPRRRAA